MEYPVYSKTKYHAWTRNIYQRTRNTENSRMEKPVISVVMGMGVGVGVGVGVGMGVGVGVGVGVVIAYKYAITYLPWSIEIT